MRTNDVLEHFGVLGMKWGRRKSQPRTISKQSTEYKTKELLKKKRISEMTNAELKTYNERMQLERQYKDLTKSSRSAGRKFVTDFLTNNANKVISNILNKQLSELMKKIVK